jgi:hypothetical protein
MNEITLENFEALSQDRVRAEFSKNLYAPPFNKVLSYTLFSAGTISLDTVLVFD